LILKVNPPLFHLIRCLKGPLLRPCRVGGA